MIEKALKIINHRDFVLSLAIVTGMIAGDRTSFLADHSLLVLGLVMLAATSGFSFRSWVPVGNALYPAAFSALLNYGVFGMLVIFISRLFFPGDEHHMLWAGFVLIAAAPPGPSIIPFSTMLKGDINFSVTGVFGLHILAMVLTPAIIIIFLGQSMVQPMEIFLILVKLIVIPLVLSRFLRHPRLLSGVSRARPQVVKWGFFLVITPIVGMSRDLLLAYPSILWKTALVFFISMFLLAWIYGHIARAAGLRVPVIVSSVLMMVIKSSAFSAVVAMQFFDDQVAAMPSAVLAVFVTLFIIFYSMYARRKYGI